MKTTKLALATLAALGGLAFTASTAAARPDIHVSVRFGSTPPPVAYCPPPAPVVRYAPSSPFEYRGVPAPVVVVGRDHRDHRHHHRAAGYWKDEVVKIWVPARWVTSHDRRGRVVRVIEPGYFTYRPDRVWVNRCD